MGEAMHFGVRAYHKSLRLPLHFAVNLKLLYKSRCKNSSDLPGSYHLSNTKLPTARSGCLALGSEDISANKDGPCK